MVSIFARQSGLSANGAYGGELSIRGDEGGSVIAEALDQFACRCLRRPARDIILTRNRLTGRNMRILDRCAIRRDKMVSRIARQSSLSAKGAYEVEPSIRGGEEVVMRAFLDHIWSLVSRRVVRPVRRIEPVFSGVVSWHRLERKETS
eukprot:727755_1